MTAQLLDTQTRPGALLDPAPGARPARGAGARRPWLTPALVGLLGLAISLAGIGTPSVWYDEAATITSSTRPWGGLLAEIGTVDLVHAAYYAGMHVLFEIVGYSPVALRVPSAAAVGVAAALTVLLGRALDRPRVGLIAGIVFCLLPRTTWMGAEGRSYALSAALAVGLTLLLVLACRSSGRAPWVLYAVTVVLGCAVFLYLALVVAAHAVTLACWLARDRKRARVPARGWLRFTAFAAVVVAPFALAVSRQSGQLHWLHAPGAGTVREVLVEQWFGTSVPFALAGWALVVAGSALLLRRSRGLSAAVVLLPALVLPTAALLAGSVVGTPIYTPRYLSMCLPFLAIVMAAAVDAVRAPGPGGTAARGGARPLSAAPLLVVALLAGMAAPQVVEQRLPLAKEGSSWAEVAALIGAERAADGPDATTAIVYGTVAGHPTASARVIAYAYPDAFAGTVDATLSVPAAASGRLWETRIRLADGLDRLRAADVVYLVTGTTRDRRPATTATLAGAGWHVAASWRLPLVHVVRYER